MKEKTFKPLLAPNEKVDLNQLKYPLLCSTKMDGIRCILYKGQILSRSLKEIPNKQLKLKLEPLRKYSEDNQCILDGEIYSPNLTFQEIVSFVMTEDFEDKKSIKKFSKVMTIPEHLKFYCFDRIGNVGPEEPFILRLDSAEGIISLFQDIAEIVYHKEVFNAKEVENYFDEVLKLGYEGLILRNPDGYYKYNRATINENLIYKVKPFIDFDGQIIDVIQATQVNEDAEKKINELGRSVTSKKKNERHTIDKASAFMIMYEGKELKVTLAMNDEQKEEVWQNKEDYIGKWITYKGMLVGAKDLPRHPVMLRFREPKE